MHELMHPNNADEVQHPKLAAWERQFQENLAAKEEREQQTLAERKVVASSGTL